jgi:protein farnesyltransferase/geranylgeranyltransferase type-1 subunit alpha
MEIPELPLNEEFEDLIAIPEYENKCPISPITYSEQCNFYKVSEIMNYFRAIISSQEVSIRAFNLTTQVINISSGFYAPWHYRRHLFNSLGLEIGLELDFVSDCLKSNPKNYQAWHYRKLLIEKSSNYTQELKFVDEILETDERNIHAWGHRQLITKKFELWDQELTFIIYFLSSNPRNNSAWHYRFFLVSNMNDLGSNEIKYAETKYCLEFAMNIQNESCYKYMENFFITDFAEEVKIKMIGIIDVSGVSEYLLQFLLFVYELEGNKTMVDALCRVLEAFDSVHADYWTHRKQISTAGSIENSESDHKLYYKLKTCFYMVFQSPYSGSPIYTARKYIIIVTGNSRTHD